MKNVLPWTILIVVWIYRIYKCIPIPIPYSPGEVQANIQQNEKARHIHCLSMITMAKDWCYLCLSTNYVNKIEAKSCYEEFK